MRTKIMISFATSSQGVRTAHKFVRALRTWLSSIPQNFRFFWFFCYFLRIYCSPFTIHQTVKPLWPDGKGISVRWIDGRGYFWAYLKIRGKCQVVAQVRGINGIVPKSKCLTEVGKENPGCFWPTGKENPGDCVQKLAKILRTNLIITRSFLFWAITR